MKSHSATAASSPAPHARLPIKVALVEDKPDVRDSWSRLISNLADFSTVCTCSSGEEALRLIPAARPDVVLMDLARGAARCAGRRRADDQ